MSLRQVTWIAHLRSSLPGGFRSSSIAFQRGWMPSTDCSSDTKYRSSWKSGSRILSRRKAPTKTRWTRWCCRIVRWLCSLRTAGSSCNRLQGLCGRNMRTRGCRSSAGCPQLPVRSHLRSLRRCRSSRIRTLLRWTRTDLWEAQMKILIRGLKHRRRRIRDWKVLR